MNDNSLIRQFADEMNTPIVDAILQSLRRLSHKEGRNFTLFAVCPTSELVLKAALIAAKKAHAPIMFAVTLNQVDLDGGYTTWTQDHFVTHTINVASDLAFTGSIIICLDHGGPWLKDLHRIHKWSLKKTVNVVKKSILACLLAGYDLLHIDTTVDPSFKEAGTVPLDTVVVRTVELIEYAEVMRKNKSLPRVSYEVGTEEVSGGLADQKTFKLFLDKLKATLLQKGLDYIWPCFIVAQVGTNLDSAEFSSKIAEIVSKLAFQYGSVIKGHYTDYVAKPERYPISGMGGANVGPEFTDIEYNALKNLIIQEKKLYKKKKISQLSQLNRILKISVIESGRWRKWIKPEERGKHFTQLPEEIQEWLIRTGCRYIWTKTPVIEARNLLYQNLQLNGIDAEKEIIDHLVSGMMKYFQAFNLLNIQQKIERELTFHLKN